MTGRALGLALVATAMALSAGCLETTGGIHARMGWSEKGMRVVHVPAGGPAAAAGLQKDDRIVTIDGAPVSTLSMKEAVERLRGPVGSRVEVEVSREDGEVVTLTIPRAPYDR
ncbi:MAG: PDZ domain-containing protein [Myxococcota bacterium]